MIDIVVDKNDLSRLLFGQLMSDGDEWNSHSASEKQDSLCVHCWSAGDFERQVL